MPKMRILTMISLAFEVVDWPHDIEIYCAVR